MKQTTIKQIRRGGTCGLVAVAAGLILTAGSCDPKGLGDAPVGNRMEAPRDVIVMPDQFPNLAVVCDATTRIYVTTREAAPVAVPDSPACEGNTVPLEEQGENVPAPEGESE